MWLFDEIKRLQQYRKEKENLIRKNEQADAGLDALRDAIARHEKARQGGRRQAAESLKKIAGMIDHAGH